MIKPKASKNSKKVWAVKRCALAVFILSLILGLPAIHTAKAEDSAQSLVYDVYAGGIHAVQATFNVYLDHKKNRYDVNVGAQTRGFLRSLAPWSGTFESAGWWAGGNDYRPEMHKSSATWRAETEIKEYKYKKDRIFNGLFITDHEKPTRQEKVDAALTDGTTDILSAALSVFQTVSPHDQCTGNAEVFDGKRRFEIVFNHQDFEDLKASKYNIYEGPSAKCTVEVIPIAGAWHKKPRGWLSIQEQGRERGTMPTVWVAKLSEKGPAVPVKIFVKTAYGALFMHLIEYRNGDVMRIANKQPTQ